MTKIYLITNNINGKKYVGKTIRTLNKRWASHVQFAKSGRDLYFCRAILKYGQEAFTVSLITEVDDVLANETEKYWIAEHKSFDPDFGYNGTLGGEGGVQTEEVRQKIGEAQKRLWGTSEHRDKMKQNHVRLFGADNPAYGKALWLGRTHKDETKKKISDARKELFQDPEFKQRMVDANTGKHHTEEGKANISKGLKGNQYRTGIPHSPEIKAQIAESVKKAWEKRRKKKEQNEIFSVT